MSFFFLWRHGWSIGALPDGNTYLTFNGHYVTTNDGKFIISG